MPELGDISGALTQGVQSGVQYATAQANLNFQKANLDMQQQNAQILKQQHEYAVNSSLYDGYEDYVKELDPNVANIKWKKLTSNAEVLNKPIDPTWKEVAKNDDYKKALLPIFEHISQLPEDQAMPALDSAMKALGTNFVYSDLLKTQGAITTLKAKQSFQAEQKDLDRETKLKTNENSVGATKYAADKKAQAVSGNQSLRKDAMVERVAHSYDQGPNMKNFINYHGRLAEGLNILNRPNVSVTESKDVLAGIVNAINRSNVTSDYKSKEFAMPTLEGKLKDLEGYVSSDPNQPTPPATLALMKQIGHRVLSTYDNQISSEAKRIDAGKKYTTPELNAVAKSKLDYYSGGYQNEVRKKNNLPPFDPNSASSGSSSSGTSSSDIRRAGQAKLIYDKMKAGPAKDAALAKIKASIPEDARKKVGLE